MASKDATSQIKTGVVRRLRADFDHTNVDGITATPLIVQDRILNSTPYPYVYVDITSVEETDVTKTGSSYEYVITIDVVNRTTQQADGKALRDAIVAEVVRILEVEVDQYIDLSDEGFDVYVQTVDSPAPLQPINTFGRTFWKTEIDVIFRISEISASQSLPVQGNRFTYSGFEFSPINRRVEFYDTGDISPLTTYSSPNNGWNFVSTEVAVSGGADGTYDSDTNNYSVGANDNTLSLFVEKDYELASDTTQTYTIDETSTFPRIRSFRYGTTTATSFSEADLADLAAFNMGDDRTIEYGQVNPIGQRLVFNGNIGDRFYIVHDAQHEIESLTDTLGTNNLANFSSQEVDGWIVLILNNPVQFNDFMLTLTLG